MIPFGYRRLRFTFQLGEGAFGLSGFDRLTVGVGSGALDPGTQASGITGLRGEVQATVPLLTNPGAAVFAIYGLTIDVMNKLSLTGSQTEQKRNLVIIEASTLGETEEDPWVTVFKGQINQAYPMMNQQPVVPMVFFAAPGDTASLQLKPVEPESIEGTASASQLIENAARKADYSVENNGVDGRLSNPYLRGSALDQVNTVLSAVGAFGTLSRTDNKIAIWPRDGVRSGEPAVLSPATGMIGYPEFEINQIKVRHLFDPSIAADPGFRFKVESPLTAANGVWKSVQFVINLACESAGGGAGGGPWEMEILGIRS